jgi:hypothetical protein
VVASHDERRTMEERILISVPREQALALALAAERDVDRHRRQLIDVTEQPSVRAMAGAALEELELASRAAREALEGSKAIEVARELVDIAKVATAGAITWEEARSQSVNRGLELAELLLGTLDPENLWQLEQLEPKVRS